MNSQLMDITVRQMTFNFNDVPKYWFDNNPLITMLFTALSAVFPPGEQGFVRSVRHYQPQVTDKKLIKHIRGFIGQEAHHDKQHQIFNEYMRRYQLDVEKISQFAEKGTRFKERIGGPLRMLANTCALEHFTAIFAEHVLNNPEILNKMHPNMRPIWAWHSIEESEHKSVAFDVFQYIGGTHQVRTTEMKIATVAFSFFTAVHTAQLVWQCKKDVKIKHFKEAYEFLFNKKNGFLSANVERYKAYYDPDFHPSQVDSSEAQYAMLAQLNSMLSNQKSVQTA